ncbi:MAG: hypothetical protein VST69_02545 [Nitrospirota bacterium]|nr:hypothetical protein [Nitrospirota bacterium]
MGIIEAVMCQEIEGYFGLVWEGVLCWKKPGNKIERTGFLIFAQVFFLIFVGPPFHKNHDEVNAQCRACQKVKVPDDVGIIFSQVKKTGQNDGAS